MTASPDLTRAIYGVDFSGARDAGRKIWIAGAHDDAGKLRVETCIPAAELPGGDVGLDAAIRTLWQFIAANRGGAFGLDFPFSLSYRAIRQATWQDFAAAFAYDYPSVDDFRDRMAAVGREAAAREKTEAGSTSAGGHERILKRQTDLDAQTPYAPHNLRMIMQTYYGIRDVLAPLAHTGRVSVLPMQAATPGRTWLLEVCPASTLKRDHSPLHQGYKFAGTEKHKRGAARDQRALIIDALEARGVVIAGAEVRRHLLADDDGNALDSVIAAFSTWRALQAPAALVARGALERIEGRVFV